MIIRMFLPFLLFVTSLTQAQKMPKVGVFYFDGWTANQWENYANENYQAGTYNEQLINEYTDRKPDYGWVTSTEKGIEQQIEDAHEAEIDFFIFDWYYCEGVGYEDCFLNHAIKLYQKANNRKKVGFCSMITNDTYDIGPSEWEETMEHLIQQFSNSAYYKIEERPLLIIYNGNRMIKAFGSINKLDNALKKLESLCAKNQIKSPIIGTINMDESKFRKTQKINFITSYNDPTAALRLYPKTTETHFSIEDLHKGEILSWKQLAGRVHKKKFFVPTVTAGWDLSPWIKHKNLKNQLFYEKQTIESVEKAVLSANSFNKNHPTNNTYNILFVNSWNEYGEGSYISRMANGDFFGLGIKKAKEYLSKVRSR